MKGNQKTNYNADVPVLEFIASIGHYVTHFMVGIICCCILYFTSCKFTYEWRVLESEFQSHIAVSIFSAAYCIITDGSRIALLLYGLRDFAIGKTNSGYFGILISIALTGFAIYESDYIASSITNSTSSKAYDFVYIGFVVTNILALILEWRMISSIRNLFITNDHEADNDDTTALPTEAEPVPIVEPKAVKRQEPIMFSANYENAQTAPN